MVCKTRARIASEKEIYFVIASKAKQSSFLATKSGLLRRCASRNDEGEDRSRRANAAQLFLRDFAKPLAQIVGVHDRRELGCGIQVHKEGSTTSGICEGPAKSKNITPPRLPSIGVK